ncbi:MAG: ATP-grasp domain-containing protein [Bdellovibrionales bacterium]|nr:ATP-grasp domain-containing protein [Bdellovibrionales bacterium]
MGIIGGGQLAQMLAMAAWDLGLHPIALAPDDSPVSLVTETTQEISAFRDFELTVIESEFEDLKRLGSFPNLEPKLDCIEIFQDKWKQKKFFKEMGFPTSAFLEIEGSFISIEAAQRELGKNLVLKWARQGYDGKGNYFLKTKIDDAAIVFAQNAKKNGSKVFAEKAISFDSEVSLMTFAEPGGKCIHYPLVQTIQRRGMCESVQSITDSKSQKTAEKYAKELVAATEITGAFAIEFFKCGKKLIVNEVAPRVHNSGHWSQCLTLQSQFHLHWLALLGELPEKVKTPRFFAMKNLIGERTLTLNKNGWPPAIEIDPGLSVHWYGKSDERPRRKLGHINVKANSRTEFRKRLALSDLLEQEVWKSARS